MKIRVTILILIFIVGTAVQLYSQNPTSIVNSEIRANYETIAVRVHFQGDDNQNNSATIKYREAGSGEWLLAHPLSRILGERVGETGKALAGSIVNLKKNNAYEVKVIVDDPDGIDVPQIDLNITTRDDNMPIGGGQQWHVASDGNDQNPGTAEAPFKTIQKAADQANSGDVVNVKAGIYRETVHITKSGAPTAFITFKAEGNIVIDGAWEELQIIDQIDNWIHYQQGVYYATIPWGFDTYYCSVDGIRFYKYDNIGSLITGDSGVQGGFYLDSTGNKRIYIKLPDGDNPDFHTVEIALLDYGFHVDNADYIVIDGFETRNFGKTERRGIGVFIDNSSHVVVQNCKTTNSWYGIHGDLDDDAANPRASYILIQNNEVYQNGLWELPWAVAYGRMGGQGINLEGAEGNNVIRRNQVRGFVDGIVLGDGAGPAFNDDIYDNEVCQTRDDAIELDCDDINVKVWNNRIHEANSCISHAEAAIGPLYIFQNTIWGFAEYSLKNRRDGGATFHYNNTIIATSPTVSPVIYLGTYRYNQVFKNNIFLGQRTVLFAGSSIDALGCIFDHNLYFTSDQNRFILIGSTQYANLQDFRNATGHELGGIAGYPEFINSDIGDFRLTSFSPCIDAGENIPNFCEGYAGNAPDIGAFEFNGFNDTGPTYIAGEVSGQWIASRSPYIATDDLILRSGQELVIDSGTEIYFKENRKFEVQQGARLTAKGTVSDSIIFRGFPVNSDSNCSWGGIRLLNADSATSFFFCKFSDGYSSPFIFSPEFDNYGGVLLLDRTDAFISHCRFEGNRSSGAGGAIAVFDSDPIIEYSEILNNFSDNDAGGIFLQNSQANIRNCLIAQNSCLYDGGGIYCDGNSNIQVTNSLIVQNYAGDDGGGGMIYDSQPEFVNCTIADNKTEGHGGAVRISTSETVKVLNSIAWGNQGSSVFRGSFAITYSCVQGGSSGTGNIQADPLFIAPDSLNYYLAANSPCIDHGNPAAEYNDPEDSLNMGMALFPAQGGLRNDMGAYGGPGAIFNELPTIVVENLIVENVPNSYQLKPCYPNPFNASTKIEFVLPKNCQVQIAIYNLRGQKLQSYDYDWLPAGVHTLQWNVHNVSSGLYIIRLVAHEYSQTQKALLIK